MSRMLRAVLSNFPGTAAPEPDGLCDRIQKKEFAESLLQFFAAFTVLNVGQSLDRRTQETLEFTTGKHFPVDVGREEFRVAYGKR